MTEPETLALPIEVPRLFACTPSKLDAYLDCPRKYGFVYVQRPKGARRPWAHLSLGASVHLALARWWDLAPHRRTPAAAAGLLAANWNTDGFRDDAQEDRAKALAQEWVEGYTATLDPSADPLAVEREVAAKSPRLAFRGRVDRLDEDPETGELVVVDYKTGARPLAPDQARGSLALSLYAAAAARMFRRPCRRVELHHLPSGEIQSHTHDELGQRRAVQRAEAIASDALEGEAKHRDGAPFELAFPARSGPGCARCDFRELCPEGREAAPEPAAAWSSLPVEIR